MPSQGEEEDVISAPMYSTAASSSRTIQEDRGHAPSPSLPYQNVPSPELQTQRVREKGKGRATLSDYSSYQNLCESPSPVHPPEPEPPFRVPGMGPTRSADRPTVPATGDNSGIVNAPVVMLLVKRMEGMNQTMYHFQSAMVSEMRAMNQAMSSALTALAGSSGVGQPSGGSKTKGSGSKQRNHGGPTRVRNARSEMPPADDEMDEDRNGDGHVSGNEAGDEDEGDDDDEFSEEDEDEDGSVDMDVVRLRARVRKVLDTMLGIHDWKTVAQRYPPLTEEEIKSVAAREDMVTCSAENFRVDFHKPWKRFEFNKIARDVFISNFLATVASGAFMTNPTPRHLLTREAIGDVLDRRMKYCRLLYRCSIKPLSSEDSDKASRHGCMVMRRKTLLKSRRRTVIRRNLNQHAALLKQLKPRNMSGDETDGPSKTHLPTWSIVISDWQSLPLRTMLWRIDEMGIEDWLHPKGTRATQGNPPRLRILRDGGKTEDGNAPSGLHRNCYNPAWLDTLCPHQLRNLQMIDTDYDFSI